ncbi:glycosyltransferase [Magnetovirga frankeli]|uniref:CgeB family protein n=1 Tax=Magnetovirga frankeli TaxID=947516 RepID=UPI001293D81F|nr:glycosyltransferase [gamma proteobacterium SS-5]
MKILVVGALAIEYVRWHWVEPIRSRYEALFVDVSPLLNSEGEAFAEAYLLRILGEHRPQQMFFYSDAIQPFFSDGFFEQVRAQGVEVLTFHADDDPEVWFRQNQVHDHRYDGIFSPSRRGVERRLASGVEHVSYLPWGYNTQRFPLLEPSEEVYDVVFVGTNLEHEAAPGHYYRDGDSRQRLLVGLYHLCQERNVRLSLFGYGWDRHPVLKECYEGFPSHAELQEIYRRTRILFNPGFSADDVFDWQTKLRHFEVAGSGLFQIVNANPELADLFEENEEIVFYRDLEDLGEKISRYLPDRKERHRVGRNAARKAREQHAIERRLEHIFRKTGTRRPGNAPSVESFYCADRSELQSLYDALLAGTIAFESNICQIIAGPLAVLGQEWSIMPPGWERRSVDLWGVRSYVQLDRLHGNVLQRKKQDIKGVLLSERMDPQHLGGPFFDALVEELPWIRSDGHLYPLCNLLIRVECLREVLAACLGHYDQAFRIQFTGRVVNDFELKSSRALPLPGDDYLTRLGELLRQCLYSGHRLLIYGARGEMADQVLKMLAHYPGLNLVGLMDQGIAGRRVANWIVAAPHELETLRPDLILIAAESSGLKIHEFLQSRGVGATILPLYDMKAPMWQVVLP